ncbi:MAG: response regulator, partial [Dehalococcoidia bacterium]
PIIMVTAYADLDAVAGARDTGVNEFMAKPISAAALEKRILHVLEDPRAFVESEQFSGPDRRRGKKVSLGGPERREEEPTFLYPPRPSLSEK